MKFALKKIVCAFCFINFFNCLATDDKDQDTKQFGPFEKVASHASEKKFQYIQVEYYTSRVDTGLPQ